MRAVVTLVLITLVVVGVMLVGVWGVTDYVQKHTEPLVSWTGNGK